MLCSGRFILVESVRGPIESFNYQICSIFDNILLNELLQNSKFSYIYLNTYLCTLLSTHVKFSYMHIEFSSLILFVDSSHFLLASYWIAMRLNSVFLCDFLRSCFFAVSNGVLLCVWLVRNLVDPRVLMNVLRGNDKALACNQTVSTIHTILCPVDNDHIRIVSMGMDFWY